MWAVRQTERDDGCGRGTKSGAFPCYITNSLGPSIVDLNTY